MTKALDDDRARGRRLALAMEALGDAISSCSVLPPQFRPRAESLREGRSVVPADELSGEGFVEGLTTRMRERASVSRAGDGARALHRWLGRDFAEWLGGGLDAVPEAVELFGIRPSVALARDARLDLLDLRRDDAEAFARWFAEGRGAEHAEWSREASAMALEEAVDRWCGLGCEGSLAKYVGSWQRSASGWVERALGGGTAVDPGDLGKLRALRITLEELRKRRVPKKRLEAMLAERLDVTVDDVRRLMATEAEVRARRDPATTLGRRWAIVRPIAIAVADLSNEGEKTPSVEKIARYAGVHRVLVELALDALADG